MLHRLPAPTTFAEGQRALALWFMTGGGIVLSLFGFGLSAVMVWGPWTPASEALRLKILGGSLAAAFIGSLATIVALAVGGPVGRFSGRVSKDGAEITAVGDAP